MMLTCFKCGEELSLSHYSPVIKGGHKIRERLKLYCKKCGAKHTAVVRLPILERKD